jgi:signal recognition particle receptor subunit beta
MKHEIEYVDKTSEDTYLVSGRTDFDIPSFSRIWWYMEINLETSERKILDKNSNRITSEHADDLVMFCRKNRLNFITGSYKSKLQGLTSRDEYTKALTKAILYKYRNGVN